MISRRSFLSWGFDAPPEPSTPPAPPRPPRPAPPQVVWQEDVVPDERGAAGADRVAHVLPFSCLEQTGTGCSVCTERCPVAGALVRRGRALEVTDACDGCGRCAEVCPAPGGAILLVPRALRSLR